MEMLEFLKQSKNASFWNQFSLFCFIGKSYPLLFFRLLHQSDVFPQKPEYVDFEEGNFQPIVAKLVQSFLGQSSFYLLGNCLEKSGRKKAEILKFIQDYEGPHVVSLFVSTDCFKDKKTLQKIYLPESLTQKTFMELAAFFDKDFSSTKKVMIDRIFKYAKTISIDEACRFLDYFDLIGLKMTDQLDKWIGLFLEPEKSLFTLADYFFARNNKFFTLWNKISDDYPDLFWIMYWSDQVWRAYYVVKFQRQKKFQEARKVSPRLPFAFVRRYWREFSSAELAKSHDFLYKADFATKTGSNFCFLDLFFSNHFLKRFANGPVKLYN